MNRFWKNFLVNGAWWTAVIVIWTSVTNSDLKAEHAQLDHFVTVRVVMTVFVSAILAFLNSLMEWFIERQGNKFKMSFRKKMLLILIRQFIFVAFIVVVVFSVLKIVFNLQITNDFGSFLSEFQVGKFWVYAVVMAYTFDIVKAVDQKLGPGNLWKLIIGEFSQPKEMERIFMFLDLRGSTTLAEKLGNISYSELIQDCFHDISVVQNYGAEVFQYVGDEVVLVWHTKKGLSSFNCIEAYFAFMNRINEKADYYKGKYGVVPFFKAGVHSGTIVLAEVGEIKREIAYHGDTINTASRIQKKCNEFNQSLIVSEALIQSFHEHEIASHYSIEELGSVSLKGKEEHVKIVGLHRK